MKIDILKKFIIAYAIIILLLLGTVLTLAPWLDNEQIRAKVYEEKADQDGTKGWGCDYKVFYAPLGRWVASCEGGYYVTFWGEIF